MKKLMMMLGIIAVAATTQAATWIWSNPYGLNAYDQPGSEGQLYSGTVYLMNESTVSQAAFISAVLGASDYSAAFAAQVGGAFSSMNIDDGATEFDSAKYEAGTSQSFYVVALDTANNGVYVSELTDPIGVSSVGDNVAEFYHDAAYANGAFANTQKTFAGAGWYTAVPEPTSGLLMLVGLAGLALRRRRV